MIIYRNMHTGEWRLIYPVFLEKSILKICVVLFTFNDSIYIKKSINLYIDIYISSVINLIPVTKKN